MRKAEIFHKVRYSQKKTIHKVIFYQEKPKKYPDLGHVLTKYDLKVVLLDFQISIPSCVPTNLLES